MPSFHLNDDTTTELSFRLIFFAMKNWRQSILRRNRINRMEWIVCLWVTAVGAHTPCFHWWKLMELSALNWIRFMPKRSHNIFLSYALRLATNIINISRLFMIIRLSADAQPHWLDSAILLAVIYIDCHSKVNAEAPSMAYFRPAIVWIYKAVSYRFFFCRWRANDDDVTTTVQCYGWWSRKNIHITPAAYRHKDLSRCCCEFRQRILNTSHRYQSNRIYRVFINSNWVHHSAFISLLSMVIKRQSDISI